MLQDPAWNIGWDNNLKLAAKIRTQVFAQAAAQKNRTFDFHLPFPGLGCITPKGKGYTWLQERSLVNVPDASGFCPKCLNISHLLF